MERPETASIFPSLPPKNTTGNYVKVAQRIPVRIDFTNLTQEDGGYLLRPGFAVTPDVAVNGDDVHNVPGCP